MQTDIINVIIESDSEDEEIIICQGEYRETKYQENEYKETKCEETPCEETKCEEPIKQKKKRVIKPKVALNICFDENPEIIEIGIDESGRGPLFGRVYDSAVVLPKITPYKHENMKDSKKFHSKSKIESTAEYIKENAIAWSVKYEDENTIDQINILQATQKAMHECVNDVLCQLAIKFGDGLKILLLIDGNYFKPYTTFNYVSNKYQIIPYHTIEQGDDKFTSIAAASILAKVERDKYIDELCKENPELKEKYKIDTNKGYGSKHHLDGIRKNGITPWHRKTFGICKNYC